MSEPKCYRCSQDGMWAPATIDWRDKESMEDCAKRLGYDMYVDEIGDDVVSVYAKDHGQADNYLLFVDVHSTTTITVIVDGFPSYLAVLRELQPMIELRELDLVVEARRREQEQATKEWNRKHGPKTPKAE